MRARCREDEETSARWSRHHRTVPIVKVQEPRRPAWTVLSVRRKGWAYLKPETSRKSDRGAMVPTAWPLPALSPARNRLFRRSTSRESMIWCRLTYLLSRSSRLNPFFRSLKTRLSRKPRRKVGRSMEEIRQVVFFLIFHSVCQGLYTIMCLKYRSENSFPIVSDSYLSFV